MESHLPVNRPVTYYHSGEPSHITLTRKVRRMDDNWLLYRGMFNRNGSTKTLWIPPSNWKINESGEIEVTKFSFDVKVKGQEDRMPVVFENTVLIPWSNRP